MRTLLASIALSALLCGPVYAQSPDVSDSDTIASVLTAQKGKRVVLRLRSGQDVTGTVKAVTPKLVHLATLSGREFFDAVIALESIESVQLRTRQ
ncbi:MAG: hypothetical protein AMJ64_14105 [Betaproteobacteria bacterium SG8_39]|nr:MAG: hypothetical protein AMJ64_14105 [Betaproteobacteria bacterium SG8_39]